MQMLAAGGMTPLTDGRRVADASNPRGYYEWEKIKSLPREAQCIAEAEGKVVKVISVLLPSLAEGFDYRVIFVQRPLAEVAASQAAMIRTLGTAGTGMPHETLVRLLETHLAQVKAWLNTGRPGIEVHWLGYHATLADPRSAARSVQAFLGIPLKIELMAGQVDAGLCHHDQQSGVRPRVCAGLE
jgi:hypothetical protein